MKKGFGTIVVLAGIVSLIISSIFFYQGMRKANLIASAMQEENVSYKKAKEIKGIVDTAAEAEIMAGVLKSHRMDRYGTYGSLGRHDPKRVEIIKAITLESSLHLATLGYGLTQVVKGVGAFIGMIGLLLIGGGAILIRSTRETA